MPRNISYTITAVDKFSAVADKIAKSLDKIQKSMGDVNKGTKNTAKQINKISKAAKPAQKEFKGIDKAVKNVSASVKKVNAEPINKIAQAAQKSSTKVAKVGDAASKMSGKVSRSSSSASRSLDKISQKAGQVSQKVNDIGASFAGFGVAAVGAGTLSVLAADEQLKSEARLTNALGKKSQVLDRLAGKTQSLTRFKKADVVAGQAQIASLIRGKFSFEDTEKIISNLTPLVADLATTMNMDMVGAAQQVAETFVTSGAPIANLGLTFKGTEGSALKLKEIIDGLKEKVGGAAKKMGDAGIGPIVKFWHSLNDLNVVIGKQLMPKLTNLAEKLKKVVGAVTEWVKANPALASLTFKIITFTLALAAALGGLKLAAMGVKFFASAITLLTSPVGLIIAGIALLVAGVVLAYKKSERFRDVINSLWQAMMPLREAFSELVSALAGLGSSLTNTYKTSEEFRTVINFLLTVLKEVGFIMMKMIIEPLKLLIKILAKSITMVSKFIKVISGIKNSVSDFKSSVKDMLPNVSGTLDKVGSKFASFGKSVKGFLPSFLGGGPQANINVDNSTSKPTNIIPMMEKSRMDREAKVMQEFKSRSDVNVNLNAPPGVVGDVSTKSNGPTNFNVGQNMAFGAG